MSNQTELLREAAAVIRNLLLLDADNHRLDDIDLCAEIVHARNFLAKIDAAEVDESVFQVIHVIPCGDLREHVEHGQDCWCKPALDYVQNNGLLCGWIVIHNAADGREQYETGERKHQ